MARIVKTATGKWQAHVCVNRNRQTKSFKIKVQAQEWARNLEYKLAKGDEGVSSTHTLGDVLNRYAGEITPSKKGCRWELVRITKLLRDPITQIKLSELRREDFEEWIRRNSKTIKSSSINREISLLSHALTQARRWRLMTANPLADLQRPKNPPARDRRIYPHEIEKLMIVLNYNNECSLQEHRQRVALALLFAIETGMRAGEICSLTAASIVGKTAYLPETKNGTSRYVPLTPRALEIVNKTSALGLQHLFGLTAGTLSTLFRKAVIAADIKDLTFHDSRHEAITRLAQKLHILDLARAVGHKNIKQLQTYYNKSAADIAEELL